MVANTVMTVRNGRNFYGDSIKILRNIISSVIFVLREKVGNRTARFFFRKIYGPPQKKKKNVVYYILPVNEVILWYFYRIPCKTKRFLRWTVKNYA